MKKITEVITSFEYDFFIHIDVYFKDEEYGKCVALIDIITGRVIFRDNDFRAVPEVEESIEKRLEELKHSNQLLEVVDVFLPVDKKFENDEIFNKEMKEYFRDELVNDSNKSRFIGFSNFYYDEVVSTVYALMYLKLDKNIKP